MNYLCLVDNVVEYGSTDLADFNHYRMIYYEDHKDLENVEYLVLTDEAYDEMDAQKAKEELDKTGITYLNDVLIVEEF